MPDGIIGELRTQEEIQNTTNQLGQLLNDYESSKYSDEELSLKLIDALNSLWGNSTFKDYLIHNVKRMGQMHADSVKRMIKFAMWLNSRFGTITPELIKELLEKEEAFIEKRAELFKRIKFILENCLTRIKNEISSEIQGINLYSSFGTMNTSLLSDIDVLIIWRNKLSYNEIGDWENIQKRVNKIISEEFNKEFRNLGLEPIENLLPFPRRVDSFPKVLNDDDSSTYESLSIEKTPILVASPEIVTRLRETLPNKYGQQNTLDLLQS